jgi:adenylylsulfate kinase
MESHKRSIVKALAWRIIAAFITAMTVYVFTREGGLSIGVGVADSAIKILVYYAHERAWNRVSFGKRRDGEQDYAI